MAKSRRSPPATRNERQKPRKRQLPPDIVHSSVYLSKKTHEALRKAAFDERCKIHDIIMEGIELALRKRKGR